MSVAKLCEILATRFDEGELRTLCLHLDIDFDDLPAVGKANKARELVRYLHHRNRIPRLIETGKKLRPDIDWDKALEEPEATPPTPIVTQALKKPGGKLRLVAALSVLVALITVVLIATSTLPLPGPRHTSAPTVALTTTLTSTPNINVMATLTQMASPTTTSSPMPDYINDIVFLIADAYQLEKPQLVSDESLTSDLFDEALRRCRGFQGYPVHVIRTHSVVSDIEEARVIAAGYRAALAVVVFGGYEVLEQGVFVEFSFELVARELDVGIMELDVRDIREPEEVQSGMFRLQWPEEVGSGVSFVLGNIAYNDGDYDTASVYFDNALQGLSERSSLVPRLSAWFLLGNSCFRTGKTEDAISAYKAALGLAPRHRDIHYNLGQAYYRLGDVDAAMGSWEHLMQLAPNDYEANYNLGILYAGRERYEDAVAAFTRAIAGNPNRPEAYSSLGATLYLMGDLEAALEHWRICVEKDDHYHGGRFNLAWGYYYQKEYLLAAEQARAAIELQPDHAESYEILAIAYEGLGRLEEARSACTIAIQLVDGPEGLEYCPSLLSTP